MNGYKIMAEAYRQAKKQDPKADVDGIIKTLDFLATCTQEEIYELFNSSAFNNIVMGYVKIALNDFEDLDYDIKDRISNHVRIMFDTVGAKQAEAYNREN